MRRIETAYDDLGRRETVTQLNSSGTSGGTVLDQAGFSYDGWSNVASYRQDVDSAFGGSGDDEYEVSTTWAKATSGRASLRRTGITLPSGASVSLDYRSASGRFDDAVSRVTSLTHGSTVVVSYDYLGLGQVVGTDYLEPQLRWRLYEGSTSGVYADLDRFGRIVHSRWTKYGQLPFGMSPPNIYHVEFGYDRNSNILWAKDHVHSGFDVEYGIDGIDRLTLAKEGALSGATISGTPTRSQEWELDQVGNWNRDQLDRDGDGFFTGPGEWDDCRTHNDVNELVTRDLDCSSSADHTLAYDAAGNLIDDGNDYKYVYDAFYRLRKILNRSNDALISEHRYNGLGHRIAVHADTDDDGDADGSDTWEHLAYDERWRLIARYWAGDTDPYEQYLHHQAGLDGHGGSSYIDLVTLRDRDTDDNGSLDERVYYCQNWRADVSVLVRSDAQLLEWVKYSAYGVPFGLPAGDTDSDGDRDEDDRDQIDAWAFTTTCDVRGDLNLDGAIDSADKVAASGDVEMGRGVLSASSNQFGFAGYESLVKGECANWSARRRIYDPYRGSWFSRDLGGYIDGVGLYQYVQGRSVKFVDWSGRYTALPSGGALTGGGGPLPGHGGPLSEVNEENCCRLAKHLGKDGGAAGGAMCCSGILVICSWLDREDADHARNRYHAREQDPYWDEQTTVDSYAAGYLAGGSKCVKEHEEYHRSKGHFGSCAGIGFARAPWSPSLATEDARNAAELEAREFERSCLEQWDKNDRKGDCNDASDQSACSQGGYDRRKWVQEGIDSLKRAVEESQGKGD